MSNYKGIQHGEVYLKPVSRRVVGATKHTEFIVAHSETGHHHVLTSKSPFEVLEAKDKATLIRLFEPAELVHQKTTDKHKTLTVEPGVYEVHHKTEYDPFDRILKQVRD